MRWVKYRVHISWIVAVGSVGFVAGVWAALLFSLGGWSMVLGGLLVVSGLLLRRMVSLLLVGCGFFLLGLSYGASTLGYTKDYGLFVGSEVVVSGSVREDPSYRSSQQTLQLKNVSLNDTAMKKGSVLVTVPRTFDIKRGDIVRVKGPLKESFGSFSASLFRGKVEDISRPNPGDVGRRVRDWFADKVRSEIKDPQASLGIGFLTGQKSALPEDLSESMKIVGLTHIVVASGYNLTILVRMSRRLFLKVSKYLSVVSAGIMIVSFVAVAGVSPSMTRAALVSSLSLAVWYYGGVFHPIILLSFAAAVTVLFQPHYVWGDLGWQLSFAAFFGVMIISPLLQRYFFGAKEPGILRQIAGETISAHLATIPIIAGQFGLISNVAIVANLLVVPLVPLAMLLTFIVGVLSSLTIPVSWVAFPTELLLSYMTKVATILSDFSWAQSQVDIPPWVWFVYVFFIVLACYWMFRATKYDFRSGDAAL